MSNFLRHGTSQVIRFGPFVSSSDGFTPMPALTIQRADMQMSKNGAAFAQKNAVGDATHDADGWYSTTLDTTDTAVVGIFILQINVMDALPVWHEYYVLPTLTYDALFDAGAFGFIQSTGPGRTVDVTANGTVGIDWGNVENPSTAVDLSGTGISLCDVTTTNTDMRGTDSALLAASVPANFSDLQITMTTGRVDVNINNDKTGYSISGTVTTLDGLNDPSDADNTAYMDANSTQLAAIRSDIAAISAGNGATAQEVRIEMDTNSTQLAAIRTDIANLNDFDPAFDTVANVTTVATCSVNSDMVSEPPTTAEIRTEMEGPATKLTNVDDSVAALNDFDPATDTVANVTNCANNADMIVPPANFEDMAITPVTGRVDVNANNDKDGYSISGTKTTLDSLNDISVTDVNGEVLDVLTVDVFPELNSVPLATSSIVDKLNWLFALGRNRITQTSSVQSVRNDGNTLDIGVSSVSDDGMTFTRDKFS